MLFRDISILDEHFHRLDHQDVLVEGSRIAAVSPTPIPKERARVIDGRDKLLIPGLYNLHTHLPMTLLRGYGEDLPLQRWLEERIFPFEDHLDPQRTYWASALGIAEMIRCGVVSCSDMYFFCDSVARACEESGIKATLSRSLVSFDDSDLFGSERFLEAKELFENWNGRDDGRIRVDMSVHAEYTNTEKTVSQLAAYAKEIGTGMHIHLSETKKEHEECKQRRGGKTPAEFMARCGVLEVPVTFAHCVWVEEQDVRLLSSPNVTVAHCPVSNLKLGSGVAPIGKMLEQGVRVALGTDGVASNNNGNLLEELKLAPLLQKGVEQNPELVTCAQALAMATVNGAAAQGRADCGSLREGNRADLVMIDLDQPNLIPCHDILSGILYSLSPQNIVMTMADGRVLYENGEYKTLDLERVLYEARRCTGEILGELKG